MCSITKTLAGSIAGQSPQSTMLGGAAVGSGPMGSGAKRVAGGLAPTMLGGAGGGDNSPGTPGGAPRNDRGNRFTMMQE